MRALIGMAAVAGASVAGASAAQAEVSANVALTTDYVFRGVSLSDNGPAIQGGFDWSSQQLYAGVWGSSVSEGVELVAYGGLTPTTGAVEWDLGAIGYFFPGADDDAAELDYVEYLLGARLPFAERFAIGAALYYAPDNYSDTGEASYYELSAEYAPVEALLFSAAYGNQSIEDPDGLPGGAGEDDYSSWNLGATYAIHGFTLDLRYHDTDIDPGSDIAFYTDGPASYDAAFVFSIGREL